MNFCYFVPDWRKAVLTSCMEIPEDAGLRMLFFDRSAATQCGFAARPGAGPGGREGTLLSAVPAVPEGREFDPVEFDSSCRQTDEPTQWEGDRQKWLEVQKPDGTTAYFIGWNKCDKPKPADVQRANQVDGHALKLEDGHEWLIPVVGPVRTRLPMSFRKAANGEMRATVTKKFRDIFERSQKVGEAIEDGTLTVGDAWVFAVDLLSINYRIGAYEAGADCLDVVTTNNLNAILHIALGQADLEKELEVKKNADATARGG